MVQSVLFENLPYTSKKHTFRNREEVVNSNVLVFKNSRIGIGTQEPEENYRVTISGNTVIRGTLTAEILSFTASNLNHLTIDNLGTQEGINLIQRGYDPYIVFRSNKTSIVNIIDGNGNVGIGEAAPLEKLVVRGKIIAEDLLLTSESIYQKPLQVPPIHQTFIVKDRADVEFMVETTGLYAASNENAEVYLNGYKLAYFSSNLKDYVVSYSNQYEPPKTFFNITLTSVAKANDVIDVTFWPTTLDQVEGTLGGYSTQSIYSYWDRGFDKSVYYNAGNIGIGTYQPRSLLDVNGRIVAKEYYGSGAGLSNVPGAFEKINNRDSVYMIGNIGIGTNTPMQKLDIDGSIYATGSVICSNIYSFGTLNVLTTISSNTNRMVIQNANSSTALTVLQTGLDFPVAEFNKGSNDTVLFISQKGNVGIGTNNPFKTLDIRGDLYVSGNVNCSNISSFGQYTVITTVVNQTEQLVVDNAGSATALSVTQSGYNKVAEFFRSNISLVQIAYDGNVGIGTNIPTQQLDVRGTIGCSNLSLSGDQCTIKTTQTSTLLLDSPNVLIAGNFIPTACNVYDLGSSNFRFKDLYLSGNTIDLGGTKLSRDDNTGGIKMTSSQGENNSIDLEVNNLYSKASGYISSNVGIGTTSVTLSLEIWSSNAILLPRGNTIDRPNPSTKGSLRYNTDLNTFEGYTSSWVPIPGFTPWVSNGSDIYYTNGNIGIGKINPTSVLDVNGTIKATQIIGTIDVSSLVGTLSTSNGGTGFNTYAVGDLLYASGATTLSKLADVTTGNSLISGGIGVAPLWDKIGLNTHVSGTLLASNGGTGVVSYNIGDLLYASGTTTLSKLADVTTGNVLLSGGINVAPTWGKVGLTTHVSDILPVLNGGTGASSSTGTGAVVLASAPSLITPIITSQALGTISNGEIEYDGDVFYGSKGTTYRGAIPIETHNIINAARPFTNVVTTIQQIFSTNITLIASTMYKFEMIIYKIRTASAGTANAHTINISFTGTATLTSINFTAIVSRSATIGTPTASTSVIYNTAASSIIGASFTGLNEYTNILIKGVVRINGAGTLIPNLAYITAAPVTTPTAYVDNIQINSYISFYPVGTNTATTIGSTWA